MYVKKNLEKICSFFKRNKKYSPKKFWVEKIIKSMRDSPEVKSAFMKTEIRRKRSFINSPWDRWKIFIDGEFMGYIRSGETKIIDKQGFIFIDIGWFNEDGSYKKWVRLVNKSGIDLLPTFNNSTGTRFDLEYFECSVNWWKFVGMSLGGDWDNYGRLEHMFKDKEYSLLPEDS